MSCPSRKPPPFDVLVGIDLAGEIVPAGRLLIERNMTPGGDRSLGSFSYLRTYLAHSRAVPVDPVHLPLQDREARFACFGGLPPAVRDASPDSWGRAMIERLMRMRGITAPIGEVDYLLTSPLDRVSNLHFARRFTREGTPDWDHLALRPPDLPDLAALHGYVARALRASVGARGEAPPSVGEILPLITGAGGARPKVTIRTADGVWLVKLVNVEDDIASMPRMEAASIEMARVCGIQTARVRAQSAGEHDLLLVKRFDFDERGHKLQMISAMTVLDASEDPYSRRNWSYPLLARKLDLWSMRPVEDKLALFRCMVLRALLSDRDDHPRNYALYRVGTEPGDSYGQWRLTPMYDCVTGLGRGLLADSLLMEIGSQGGLISRENMLSKCHDFGLSREQAEAEIGLLEGTVLQRWEEVFTRCGVSAADRALAAESIKPLDMRQPESFNDAVLRRMRAVAAARQANAEDSAPMRPREVSG